jgi:hypothetical protein
VVDCVEPGAIAVEQLTAAVNRSTVGSIVLKVDSARASDGRSRYPSAADPVSIQTGAGPTVERLDSFPRETAESYSDSENEGKRGGSSAFGTRRRVCRRVEQPASKMRDARGFRFADGSRGSEIGVGTPDDLALAVRA